MSTTSSSDKSTLLSQSSADDGYAMELQWLTQNVNVLSLIARGGVGKTALLAYWVRTRFVDHGCQNEGQSPIMQSYFDWTFYDQGTRDAEAKHAGAASVGDFFPSAGSGRRPNTSSGRPRRCSESISHSSTYSTRSQAFATAI